MIPRATALHLARHVERLLAPACVELMVVGSVRRGRDQVKDIELAVRSKPAAPVFGEPRSAASALEALLARLLRERELHPRPTPSERKDGPRHKTFWLPTAGGVGIDLFIADPRGDNWGNTVAIRTGDFEFSRMLVTKRSAGGLLPKGFLHHEGYLQTLGGGIVPCPTEAMFFKHLGVFDIPSPAERDLRTAERLRGRMAAERTVKA